VLYLIEKADPMPKSIRIAPQAVPSTGQAITFVLAIGSVRQVCRLQTRFRTSNQAFSYFHKHRTQFEQIARGRLARGEVEDGVIALTML
jgi:hypothetical protein